LYQTARRVEGAKTPDLRGDFTAILFSLAFALGFFQALAPIIAKFAQAIYF
jgi:hypothetical protein